MSEVDAIRGSIEEALRALEDKLGNFCQTTHASFFARGAGLDIVLEALKRAYEKPSAFNTSELSQVIRGFLVTPATTANG